MDETIRLASWTARTSSASRWTKTRTERSIGGSSTTRTAVTALTAAGQFPSISTAAFDDCFRGTPSRRLMYRSDGTGVLRVEVDPDGDGVFQESTGTQYQSCQ